MLQICSNYICCQGFRFIALIGCDPGYIPGTGETLKRLKKAEFSIASVATITDPTVLRFAGRWLAYVVLHEFWHAAEIESDHKYENGTGLTNSPDLAARDDLTFENEVVVNVTKSYEKNWCEVSLKRKRIDELKP